MSNPVQFVDQTTKCTKEMLEVYKALAGILDAGAAAKAAGATGGALALAMAGGAMQPLVAAIDGITGVANEADQALPEFVQTQGVGSGLVGAAVTRLVQAHPVSP